MSFESIKWAMEQPVGHSPAKFVLVAMGSESRDNETCWPCVASLAAATSQDRKTVITNIARLVGMGYLEDTGMRKGQTKQVIVYRFKTPEIGTVKESQIRNSSETGTVPVFPLNSTEIPHEQSQISLLTVPVSGHGTSKTVIEPVIEPINICSRDLFAEFWSAYPAKTAKPQCRAKWQSKNLDALADLILADVASKRASDRRWLDGYIPNPLTYLNQRRWEDPVQTRQRPAATNGKPPIAQNFADKTYHGTPDDELPNFLRTGTH